MLKTQLYGTSSPKTWFREDAKAAKKSKNEFSVLIYGRELKDANTGPYVYTVYHDEKSGKQYFVASQHSNHADLDRLAEKFISRKLVAVEAEYFHYDKHLNTFYINSEFSNTINTLLNLGYSVNNRSKDQLFVQIKEIEEKYSMVPGSFELLIKLCDSFKGKEGKVFVALAITPEELATGQSQICYSIYCDESQDKTYVFGFLGSSHASLYDFVAAYFGENKLFPIEASFMELLGGIFTVHTKTMAEYLRQAGYTVKEDIDTLFGLLE